MHMIIPEVKTMGNDAEKEKHMEIEKKYTVREMPEHLETCQKRLIEQGYLNTSPVIRVRRDNDSCYLTCKGSGLTAHEELEFSLDIPSYEHLLKKSDGNIITKTRYMIPITDPHFKCGFKPAPGLKLTVELDVFDAPFAPLIIAEVEFPDIQTCEAYIPEPWFDSDVTADPHYHNANMSRASRPYC